jgi:hypothetical protein
MKSLAVIVVPIMVAVMIPVSVMASCPRVFQITTAALCLAAMFTVLAFRIMQLLLRVADSLLAFSIVIAVKRSRGNGPAQERQNDKGRNKCSGFFEHASSSGCINILRLDALRRYGNGNMQNLRLSCHSSPSHPAAKECRIAV